MSLLAMFGLFRAAKFWTALVMAIIQFIQIYAGIDFGFDEATVTAVLGGIGALLVWAVPNLKPQDERNRFPEAPRTGGLY